MKRIAVAFCCAALLSLIGVGSGTTPAAAQALTKVTFSLDIIVLGRHAPFYVALDKGFYKEEGLDVNFVPSKGTAAAIQNVDSGIAQIGFTDVASLVVARAGGSTVKVVSVIYQKAPYCLFSLDPGANVTKISDLQGLKIGSNAGSFIPSIAKALMRKNGLDPNKLSVESIEPSARVAMLVTDKIPAIDFFNISRPGLERAAKEAKNAKVTTFLFADHGLDLYSNGIGATEAYLKEKPEVVKAFVRATLKGYQYTFKNLQESAEIIQKHSKALRNDITVEELKIVEELTVTPDVKVNGIGSFTPARMKSSVEWMAENGGFPKEKTPKPEDVYAMGFMPDKPVLP